MISCQRLAHTCSALTPVLHTQSNTRCFTSSRISAVTWLRTKSPISICKPLLDSSVMVSAQSPTAGGGSSSNGNSSSDAKQDSHKGHAFLHDFCMTIPFGAATVIIGIAVAVFGAQTIGMQLLSAGAATAMCSVLSLQAWKKGGSSTLYTTVSAVSSAGVAFIAYTNVQIQLGLSLWLYGALLAVSVVSALFCTYNILAGGNPPPKEKKSV